LPNLIRLGLTADLLQIQELRDHFMLKDVMTAAGSRETKAEALDELANISKPGVLKVAIEQATQKPAAFHTKS